MRSTLRDTIGAKNTKTVEVWTLDEDIDVSESRVFFLRIVMYIYMEEPVNIFREISVHLKRYCSTFIVKGTKI